VAMGSEATVNMVPTMHSYGHGDSLNGMCHMCRWQTLILDLVSIHSFVLQASLESC
jgi:hypothetical protein